MLNHNQLSFVPHDTFDPDTLDKKPKVSLFEQLQGTERTIEKRLRHSQTREKEMEKAMLLNPENTTALAEYIAQRANAATLSKFFNTSVVMPYIEDLSYIDTEVIEDLIDWLATKYLEAASGFLVSIRTIQSQTQDKVNVIDREEEQLIDKEASLEKLDEEVSGKFPSKIGTRRSRQLQMDNVDIKNKSDGTKTRESMGKKRHNKRPRPRRKQLPRINSD